jgi:erythromycin esterase
LTSFTEKSNQLIPQMKKFVWFLLLLSSCKTALVHPVLTPLFRENTAAIRSIDVAYADFKDFEAIGQDIGNARVVMLGENDHGDGETFKAKARLVRYLHEQKGFNVLAFESDFIGINSVWDIEKSSEKALGEIFGIWRNTKEFGPMKNYLVSLDNTPKAMTLAGFDSQWYNKYSTSRFIPRFIATLKVLGYNESDKNFDQFMRLLVKSNDPRNYSIVTEEEHRFLNDYLEAILQKFLHADMKDRDFWAQIVRSLKGNAADRWHNRRNPEQYSISQYKATYDYRDAQMADNLLWLANNRYKNEKIIVWAHNFHIAKNTQEVLNKSNVYPRTITHTMGSLVHQALKDDVYILGFNSYEGTTTSPYQREGRRPTKIKKNSHQDVYASAVGVLNMPYGFTSFRTLRAKTTPSPNFDMRGWGYDYVLNGRWLHCYDGLFFIQKNKATTEL